MITTLVLLVFSDRIKNEFNIKPKRGIFAIFHYRNSARECVNFLYNIYQDCSVWYFIHQCLNKRKNLWAWIWTSFLRENSTNFIMNPCFLKSLSSSSNYFWFHRYLYLSQIGHTRQNSQFKRLLDDIDRSQRRNTRRPSAPGCERLDWFSFRRFQLANEAEDHFRKILCLELIN